eukprot:m.229306 g.229306  ORF g.229306 m.229306 type:complete len:133 (-) comp11886_c0_seq1:57-455(-)
MADKTIIQDRPRAGGFPEIPYKRNTPVRGPGSLALIGIVTGTIAFGYYRLIQGNYRKSRLNIEKKEARLAIFPLLQAEEDRKSVRQEYQQAVAEAQIMSEVPNWKVAERVYNTPRFVEPVTITSEGGLVWSA